MSTPWVPASVGFDGEKWNVDTDAIGTTPSKPKQAAQEYLYVHVQGERIGPGEADPATASAHEYLLANTGVTLEPQVFDSGVLTFNVGARQEVLTPLVSPVRGWGVPLVPEREVSAHIEEMAVREYLYQRTRETPIDPTLSSWGYPSSVAAGDVSWYSYPNGQYDSQYHSHKVQITFEDLDWSVTGHNSGLGIVVHFENPDGSGVTATHFTGKPGDDIYIPGNWSGNTLTATFDLDMQPKGIHRGRVVGARIYNMTNSVTAGNNDPATGQFWFGRKLLDRGDPRDIPADDIGELL